MDNALYYLSLNRQIGLSSELDMIANNVANLDTTGFRREGLAFTEFVVSNDTGESVSMADLGARFASTQPGDVTITNGTLDVAIQGEGFFVLQSPDGEILTRAGSFQRSEIGTLTTPNGDPVLDIGLAPIILPAEAKDVLIASDGTISAGGQPLAQLAVVTAPPELISRFGDTAFTVADGAFEAVEAPKVLQGALEQSNVNPVLEIARMIEVSRAYEMAQTVIDDENDRIQETIQTLGQSV